MADSPTLSQNRIKNKMDEKFNEEENMDTPDGFRKFLKKRFESLLCVRGEKDSETDSSENRPKSPSRPPGTQPPGTAMTSELDGDIYDFNHPKRGLAVIINNEDFSRSREFGDRPGSSYDASSLYHSFKNMGFDVLLFNDLGASRMVEVLRAAINEYDHSQADCFACSILTHGDQTWSDKEWDRMGTSVRLDLLFGTDGKAIATKSIVEMFSNKNCPTLKNKPRLFFLQACRGDKYDDGQPIPVKKATPTTRYLPAGGGGDAKDAARDDDQTDAVAVTGVLPIPTAKSSSLSPVSTELFDRQVSLSSSVDPPGYPHLPQDVTDAAKGGEEEEEDVEEQGAMKGGDKTDALGWHSVKEVPVSPAPLYQDCLIMYATPPGHYAWRRKTGAWFIQCLCKLFDSNVLEHVSLLRGLSYVCGKVAREYQSENPNNPTMHHKKEVPVVESQLIKDVFMTKKPVSRSQGVSGSRGGRS